MDMSQICTISGLCYSMGSSFLSSAIWSKLLASGALNAGKRVWSSRSAYKVVLEEAQLSTNALDQFERSVESMEQMHKSSGINVCSLLEARVFIREFRQVLSAYDEKMISLWQKNNSGEALRIQLQYYINFMGSSMSNVLMDISIINMNLQLIATETDPMKKAQLKADLEAKSNQCKMMNKRQLTFRSPFGEKSTENDRTLTLNPNDFEDVPELSEASLEFP